jgi:hypothetical protein
MKRAIEDILDECLEAVRRGAAVEECLARHAEHAAELRELLAVAKTLERSSVGRRVSPGLATALGTVRAELEHRRRSAPVLRNVWNTVRPYLVPAAAVCAAAVLVIMTIRALPGDALYPAKLAGEELLAGLSGGVDNRMEVDMRLADARMAESHAAAQRRGRVDVAALASVHVHAETALSALDRIPETELPSALARMERMHRRHLEMLNDMRAQVRGPQVSEVDRSIRLCSDRIEWVGQLRHTVRNTPRPE